VVAGDGVCRRSPAHNGTNAQHYDAGPRFGLLAGWRASGILSINVQGLIDQVHTASQLAFKPYWVREAALAPLVHLWNNELEFVFGPRLGLWSMSADYEPPFDGATEHRRGWTMGMNAGFMLRTRVGLSLGVLIDVHTREGNRACATSPGQAETCTAGWRSEENMFAISVAAASSSR
jgi:hypothetical protein